MVKIDDLRDICPSRIRGLVERVIEARPTVQEEQRWLLTHHRAIRHQLCAFHIEEQAHAVDQNMHDNSPSLVSMKVLR